MSELCLLLTFLNMKRVLCQDIAAMVFIIMPIILLTLPYLLIVERFFAHFGNVVEHNTNNKVWKVSVLKKTPLTCLFFFFFFSSLKEFLPKEYTKQRGAEKRIFQVIVRLKNLLQLHFCYNKNDLSFTGVWSLYIWFV